MKISKRSYKGGIILSSSILVIIACLIVVLVKIGSTGQKHKGSTSNHSDYSNKYVETKAALEKSNRKAEGLTRQEKIENGEISNNHRRITLDEAKKIASEGKNLKDIREAMNDIHAAPDFIGGSGVSLVEYWLDSDGIERIIFIIEQNDIYYSKRSVTGKVVKSEMLF